MLVRTLARICDYPYDPVFSAPVPPVAGRRVVDLGDFGFIEFVADEATKLVRVYHLARRSHGRCHGQQPQHPPVPLLQVQAAAHAAASAPARPSLARTTRAVAAQSSASAASARRPSRVSR
jgi:hypothetical protein